MLMDDRTIAEFVRKARKEGKEDKEVASLAKLNSCTEAQIRKVVEKHTPGRKTKPYTELKPDECLVVTPDGARVEKTDNLSSDSDKLSDKAKEEKPAAVVPHIRVTMPPVVKEAVEEKLELIDNKIKYHERALEDLKRDYIAIVAYLNMEGKL
jgi:hypothetical protein